MIMTTPVPPLTLVTDKPGYAAGEPVTLSVSGVSAESRTVTVTAVAGTQRGTVSYEVATVPSVTVSDDHGGTWTPSGGGQFTSVAPGAPQLPGAEPPAAQLQAAGISALSWSGYVWELENWATAPGQPLAADVSVNAAGQLVLSAKTVNGLFAGAEVDSARGDAALAGNTSRWGYGTYRWVVATDLTTLAPGLTLGLFTYQAQDKGGPAGHKEVDIEVCAPTGNTEILQFGYYADTADGVTAAVPPLHVMTPGSQVPAVPAPATTLEFTWLPGGITWQAWYGTDVSAPPAVTYAVRDGEPYDYTEVYGGNHFAGTARIPASAGQQVIMNLWSTAGNALPGVSQQVVIDSFTFIPAP